MHNHAHDHSHSHGAELTAKDKTRLWWILLLSASYMGAEIVGGLISGSLALLADAGHMAIDAAATALGLFAIWIAQRPPTERNTYGFYRAEILAALLNGATLIAISVWILYEAVTRFSEPPQVQGALMSLVAAGGLIVNVVGLYLMAQGRSDSLNMRGVWWHLLTDTLGSLAALIAAYLIWQFNWYLADPIISAAISLLILFGAFRLVSECVNVLLEGVPAGIDVAEIKRGIEALPGVEDVHDLHVWVVTNGVPALSAHVRMKEAADHHHALEAVTKLLRESHRIEHVTIQLEPPAFFHDKLHV